MDLERSKELRDYLRKILQLPSAFPEPEKDPEFYDKVYTQLKQYYPKLCDALENAYPNEKNLLLLVKQGWEKDLGEIPNGDSYAEKLRNTIEWMESDGCLLEFIAAAHDRKARNTKLNAFVRKLLPTLLELPVSTQQIPQSEPLRLTSSPPIMDSDRGTNNHGSEISKGALSNDKQSIYEIPSKLPVLELSQDSMRTQPMPFPRKMTAIDKQPHEDPIALAYKRTRTALEKIQLVYDIFQAGEKISDPQIIESIEQAKRSIDGVSDLFVNTPTPNYLELDYRFACEERYICEKISIIATYSLRSTYINSPPTFLGADKEFQKIFSGLQNLEDFINKFQEQIQLSDHANNPLRGNGI